MSNELRQARRLDVRNGKAAWENRQLRRLQIEALEHREMLATIVVTSLLDNTTSDGFVTLREAILAASVQILEVWIFRSDHVSVLTYPLFLKKNRSDNMLPPHLLRSMRQRARKAPSRELNDYAAQSCCAPDRIQRSRNNRRWLLDVLSKNFYVQSSRWGYSLT